VATTCRLAAAFAILATSGTASAQPPEPPVSLQRIRRALDEPQPAIRLQPVVRPGDQQATYRVEIFAPRELLVPFADSLDPGWQAVAFGGVHHREIMDMITPPAARPFGAFDGGELATVAATSLAGAALIEGVTRAVRAMAAGIRKRRMEAIRREVEAELAAVKKAAARPASPEILK
jgi:hypothetical protein